MSQIIGLVLAGGQGRRLGRPKGEVVVGTSTLADRAAQALRPICSTVLVSVSRGGANPAPGYDAIEDEPPSGRGPLAGIHAAMAGTGQADLIVLACDYPGVATPLLQAIVHAADATDDLVILTDGRGRDHPLVGLWRRSTEPTVREALQDGHYKVRSLLAVLEVRRLRPEDLPDFELDQALVNVNTTEDLEGTFRFFL